MKDMTVGSPWKLLIRFTIPLLMGNLFQVLYSLIDTIVIGRALGMNALGAIGAVTSLTFFVQGFILGISSGLSLILAQRFGTRDEERIRSSFVTGIWIALTMVILLTIISITFADPLLRAMNIPPGLFDDSKAYFTTAMFGLAGLMLFSLFTNVLRSMGDTNHLLIYTVLSQLLNIILDLLFVLIIPLGVRGVALATILSQIIVGFICQNYISRKIPLFKLAKHELKTDKREVRLHLNISLPIAFQSSIISVGLIVLQFKLNGLGASAVEGHAIGARIESMAVMPLVSFGVAMATFAAQNFGAGKMDRIWQGVRVSAIISVFYSIVVGGLLVFFGKDIAIWLFGANEGKSLEFIDRYFKMTASVYVLIALLLVFRYTLQGMGKSVAPTLAGFMEMGIRMAFPLFLTGLIGFPAIVLSHPMAWAGSLTILSVALWFVRKEDHSTKFKRFITS